MWTHGETYKEKTVYLRHNLGSESLAPSEIILPIGGQLTVYYVCTLMLNLNLNNYTSLYHS